MNELLALDYKIFKIINGWNSPLLDYLIGWTTFLGVMGMILPAAFVLMAVLDKKKFPGRYVFLLGVLWIIHQAVDILKALFNRPRPYHFFEAGTVKLLFDKPSNAAFPSGHAAMAFAAAFLLNFLYGKKLSFLYLFAFLVALSRIYVGVHYPSDVIAGALFGVTCSMLAAKAAGKSGIAANVDLRGFPQK